jgi:hypothetical protein
MDSALQLSFRARGVTPSWQQPLSRSATTTARSVALVERLPSGLIRAAGAGRSERRAMTEALDDRPQTMVIALE